MKFLALFIAGSLFFAALAIVAQERTTYTKSAQPEELGEVNWNRNLDQAVAISRKTGKPLFVQFQEVPG